MPRRFEFTVYNTGAPVAKQRPRMTKAGHVYTPGKTARAEWEIRETAIRESRQAVDPPESFKWLEGPLILGVSVRLTRPASHTKKQRLNPYCLTKPDVDNYIKTVMDALNKVLYGDDGQIAAATILKRYATDDEPPCWIISLEELSGSDI